MLRLYGLANTRTLRPLWLLEEAGEPYAYVKVDLSAGHQDEEPYASLNPGRKVPTLVDGDVVLTESVAMCTYIADRHPGLGLVPEPRTADRARHDCWCCFVATELEQPLWTLVKHRFALVPDLRVPAIRETAVWEFGRALSVLETAVRDRPFLLGDRPTVADILAAQTLFWALGDGIEVGSAIVSAYADRLFDRPAFARAVARKPDLASPAEAMEAVG